MEQTSSLDPCHTSALGSGKYRLEGLESVSRGALVTRPAHLIKPLESTMETVGLSVNRQVVFLPTYGESSFGNSVGYPPNHRSEVGLLLEVTCTKQTGQVSMSLKASSKDVQVVRCRVLAQAQSCLCLRVCRRRCLFCYVV